MAAVDELQELKKLESVTVGKQNLKRKMDYFCEGYAGYINLLTSTGLNNDQLVFVKELEVSVCQLIFISVPFSEPIYVSDSLSVPVPVPLIKYHNQFYEALSYGFLEGFEVTNIAYQYEIHFGNNRILHMPVSISP